jgi:Rieske Fe-S protein
MRGILGEKQEKDFIHMNKLFAILILLGCLSISFQHCKKSTDTTDFFQPVQFKTQLNLNLPQYIALQSPQGYAYIPEGNKGTVVYSLPQGGFIAFDRTCSYNPKEACAAVTVDSNYVGLKCGHYDNGFKSCCNSIFDLNSGVAIQKPASRPLKQYYTSFDEANKVLYVSNSPF